MIISLSFDKIRIELDSILGVAVERKIQNIEADLKEDLRIDAKAWKAEAIREMSKVRPGGAPINNTMFPYLVTGALMKSLGYRIQVSQRARQIRIMVTRGFINHKPVYADMLESSGGSYSGFQERLQQRLDDSLIETLKRNV